MNSGKINYEKHQRDYTLLFASVVAEEFFSDDFREIFSYESNPIFFFIENGVFYHFVSINDYSGVPKAYFNKNSFETFKAYVESTDKQLDEYKKFMEAEHGDPFLSLEKVHKYARYFTPIILISAYAPNYIDDLDKDILDLCMDVRHRYENIHRDGIVLEKKLLIEIEKDLGIEKGLLQYLNHREYKSFIGNKELPENIKNRKDFILCKYSGAGEEIFSKNDSQKILDEIDETRRIEHSSSEIEGSAAHLGNVKGRVRIIRLIEEADDFKEGEILVASMTDPRYVPAMKKAAAFVTDEGGITCHAAIVAREMKKPCVIGTKIATSVLKDGDEVEVDADNGVVKILKRAS